MNRRQTVKRQVTVRTCRRCPQSFLVASQLLPTLTVILHQTVVLSLGILWNREVTIRANDLNKITVTQIVAFNDVYPQNQTQSLLRCLNVIL